MTSSKTFPIDSDFIVRTSSAPSRGTYGRYERHAVIEVDQGVTSVSMIAESARGVRAIIRDYGPQSVGKTDRCASAVELAACVARAAELNKAQAKRRKAAATRAARKSAAQELAAAPAADAIALAT